MEKSIHLQSLKLLCKRFRRRYICKKIQYLTLDLGVKVKQKVAHYPLHYVTYSAPKFEVATSNGLGGDTFTRNVTDGRRTDFGTKLIYHFFLKKKAGITNFLLICQPPWVFLCNIRDMGHALFVQRWNVDLDIVKPDEKILFFCV